MIERARDVGAAILAQPARDTIKRVRDGAIVETPDRAECWTAETPQVFRAELLAEALPMLDRVGMQHALLKDLAELIVKRAF